MAFVLDASMALAWCFPDEATTFAESILALLRNTEAVVPGVWSFEVANGLLAGERRGRLTESEVARSVELLESLPVHSESCDLHLALGSLRTLARQHRLSVYDVPLMQ